MAAWLQSALQLASKTIGESQRAESHRPMCNKSAETNGRRARQLQRSLELFKGRRRSFGRSQRLKPRDVQHSVMNGPALVSTTKLETLQSVGDHLGEANALKAIGDVQFRDERDARARQLQRSLETLQSRRL